MEENTKCPICKSVDIDQYIDPYNEDIKMICQRCFYIFKRDETKVSKY